MSASEFDVNVQAASFRAALVSVGAHASESPEDVRLNRIRIYFGPKTATVAATNGQTAALALVEITDHLTPELGCIDIRPSDARKLLAIFKGGKESATTLRIHASAKHLEITDVGGLFPGESLRLNACATDPEFPNVAKVITFARQLSGLEMFRPSSPLLLVSPSRIKLFIPAGLAYGTLVIEPTGTGRSLVVSAGKSFLGLLVTSPAGSEDEADRRDRFEEWSAITRDVTLSHPLPPVKVTVKAPSTGDVSSLEFMLAGPASETVDLAEPDGDALDGDFVVPDPDLGPTRLEDARQLVIATQVCGRAHLVRNLGVTQAQARDLIVQLEAEGIVGPAPVGNAQRVVLVAAPLFGDEA